MKYSVLMSVYKNEKVEYFIQAVDSLLNQTIRPEQIVLVRDGSVYEELQNVIDKYVTDYINDNEWGTICRSRSYLSAFIACFDNKFPC